MYDFIKTLAFYLNRGNSKCPDYTVAGWSAQRKFAFFFLPSLCTVAPQMLQTAPRRAITAMAVSISDAVWPFSVAYESYLYLNKISLRYPEYSPSSLGYSGLQVVKSNKMFAPLCFKQIAILSFFYYQMVTVKHCSMCKLLPLVNFTGMTLLTF